MKAKVIKQEKIAMKTRREIKGGIHQREPPIAQVSKNKQGTAIETTPIMKQAEAEAEGEEGVKEEEEEVEDRKISIAKVGRQWYPQ